MRYAWLVAAAALILAAIVSGVLTLALPVRLDYTIYDPSPNGLQGLIERLETDGITVYTAPPDPHLINSSSTALLILDPYVCEPSDVYQVLAWMREARPAATIIIGDSRCAAALIEILGLPRPQAALDEARLSVLGMANVETRSVLAWRDTPPGAGVVATADGLVAGIRLGNVVVVGDVDWLRNSVIDETYSALRRILGDVDTVVIPSALETGRFEVAAPLAPLAYTLLSYIISIEKRLAANPLYAITLAVIAGVVGYRMFSRGSTSDTIFERSEPPRIYAVTSLYQRMVRGARLAGIEAKRVIINLYELLDSALTARLGHGVKELLGDRRRLETLASLVNVDPDRLEKLLSRLLVAYERATGARRFWPIILSWGRLARRLVEETGDLLKGVGVELERLKGVEVHSIARHELRV